MVFSHNSDQKIFFNKDITLESNFFRFAARNGEIFTSSCQPRRSAKKHLGFLLTRPKAVRKIAFFLGICLKIPVFLRSAAFLFTPLPLPPFTLFFSFPTGRGERGVWVAKMWVEYNSQWSSVSRRPDYWMSETNSSLYLTLSWPESGNERETTACYLGCDNSEVHKVYNLI